MADPVVAVARIDLVDPGAAVDLVVAGAADDPVVADIAGERVDAGAAVDLIVAATAEQDVVAVAAAQDVLVAGAIVVAVQSLRARSWMRSLPGPPSTALLAAEAEDRVVPALGGSWSSVGLPSRKSPRSVPSIVAAAMAGAADGERQIRAPRPRSVPTSSWALEPRMTPERFWANLDAVRGAMIRYAFKPRPSRSRSSETEGPAP